MEHGAHLRLMVTRGEKAAANQDPRNWLGKPTIVIIAEYKEPSPADRRRRACRWPPRRIRCTPAEMFDMRLNSHSRLNLITALLEAIEPGADEALMLDPDGFVSSCNATNFFLVRDGRGEDLHRRLLLQRGHPGQCHRALPRATASRSSWATSRWPTCTAPTRPSSPAPSAG